MKLRAKIMCLICGLLISGNSPIFAGKHKKFVLPKPDIPRITAVIEKSFYFNSMSDAESTIRNLEQTHPNRFIINYAAPDRNRPETQQMNPIVINVYNEEI